MAEPPEIKGQLTTGDGTKVMIRPIRPEDREIERAFVLGLSADSRYFRFFSTLKDLSPELLDRFTQVDYPKEMAFIATIDDGDKELEIGVARYVGGDQQGSAEFAIVVADEWQGKGIGKALLDHLFGVARDVGFKRIEALVLTANSNMLRFCRDLGFAIQPYPEEDQMVLVSKVL